MIAKQILYSLFKHRLNSCAYYHSPNVPFSFWNNIIAIMLICNVLRGGFDSLTTPFHHRRKGTNNPAKAGLTQAES